MKKKMVFALAAIVTCLGLGTLSSCQDDTAAFQKEEIAYFEEQRDFIRKKKTEKDKEGQLLYKEIVYMNDTVLYRVLEKPTSTGVEVNENTPITMLLKGANTNGVLFQNEAEMTFMPKQLIFGLRPVLVASQPGGKYEALIPASLGYGYYSQSGIRGGSTLIFTFTVKEIH